MAVSLNPQAAKAPVIAMPDDADIKVSYQRPKAKDDMTDMKVRDLHEKNRQNDEDHNQSLEGKLKEYNLSRYIPKFKEKKITRDKLMSMDPQSINKLEDEIIGAAKLKRPNFEKFIRSVSMVADYQSEYLKNIRNSAPNTNVNGSNGNQNVVINNNNKNNNSNYTNNSNSNYNYNYNHIQQHNQNENSSYGSQNSEQYGQHGQYGQYEQYGQYGQQAAPRGKKKWYYFVEHPNVEHGGYFEEYSSENQFFCDQVYKDLQNTNRDQRRAITIFKAGHNGRITPENATLEMTIIENGEIYVYHKEIDGTTHRVIYQEADKKNRLFNKYQCYPEITPQTPGLGIRSPPMVERTPVVFSGPGAALPVREAPGIQSVGNSSVNTFHLQ